MSTTDYTEEPTLFQGFGQQYRISKYIKDILNNWFADQRNILDPRIRKLMYVKGQLNKDCLKLGCAFDPNKIYAGTTPAIIVSVGDITYNPRHINQPGNPAFNKNPMQSPILDWVIKNIPIIISVITESYDGTLLLTELVEMFLKMNLNVIAHDINNINAIDIQQVGAVKEVPTGQAGNAKQLFASNIVMPVASILSWTSDTQGPVFKGIGLTTKIK